MRHSDAKSRRISGALRKRALPIMDTATAVENGFPEVPLSEESFENELSHYFRPTCT